MSKCGDKACKTYFQSSETGLELNFSIELILFLHRLSSVKGGERIWQMAQRKLLHLH
jgi:hypothetical protein